jgi:hypothetical protein
MQFASFEFLWLALHRGTCSQGGVRGLGVLPPGRAFAFRRPPLFRRRRRKFFLPSLPLLFSPFPLLFLAFLPPLLLLPPVSLPFLVLPWPGGRLTPPCLLAARLLHHVVHAS